MKSIKMKNGDIVKVEDGSFSRSVINGELIHELLNYGSECGKEYVIIEIGCKLPVEKTRADSTFTPVSFNNTVIQAIESGKVVFITECFLRLKYAKPKQIREVTMNEVCKQFGEDVKVVK